MYSMKKLTNERTNKGKDSEENNGIRGVIEDKRKGERERDRKKKKIYIYIWREIERER